MLRLRRNQQARLLQGAGQGSWGGEQGTGQRGGEKDGI